MNTAAQARRITVADLGNDTALDADLLSRADQLGLYGWVRRTDEGRVSAHLEGDPEALAELTAWLARVAGSRQINETAARVEGHEQLALRGVPAGVFVVQEHQATAHHFDLRLEVDGIMRSWAIPKGPSMDPVVKRLAVQVDDHAPSHNAFEGRTGSGGVIVWDHGPYEQGGRVPWPDALERGHAVFVLHGEKLQGGFALQRTHGGPKPQWLLVKRRDEHARPGSDVVAERPESVQSGLRLDELLGF